ncbi:hypothetical protein HYZ97_03145 [Candidatus Pacearchaeota archaeon]|nr:hypothetical protein [Candidatus Pacearchaeota archaeon]
MSSPISDLIRDVYREAEAKIDAGVAKLQTTLYDAVKHKGGEAVAAYVALLETLTTAATAETSDLVLKLRQARGASGLENQVEPRLPEAVPSKAGAQKPQRNSIPYAEAVNLMKKHDESNGQKPLTVEGYRAQIKTFAAKGEISVRRKGRKIKTVELNSLQRALGYILPEVLHAGNEREEAVDNNSPYQLFRNLVEKEGVNQDAALDRLGITKPAVRRALRACYTRYQKIARKK